MRDDTRKILLTTAIRLFGRYGFEAVTTRKLAREAGVNIASIKYHFGSKDDLYAAAIDEIIGVIEPRVAMLATLAGQGQTLAGDDPARQGALVGQVVETAIHAFLSSPELATFIPFILRELFVPGPHFDRLYDAVPRRLHETLTGLVAWVGDRDPTAPDTIVRAHAVIGQLIVFHFGRVILQRRLGIADYTPADVELIGREAAESVVMSLGLPTRDISDA